MATIIITGSCDANCKQTANRELLGAALTFVDHVESSPSSGLEQDIQANRIFIESISGADDAVIVANAEVLSSASGLEVLRQLANSKSSAALLYAPVQLDGTLYDLECTSAEDLLQTITYQLGTPMAARVNRSVLSAAPTLNSAEGIILMAAINAFFTQRSIERIARWTELRGDTFINSERIACLKQLIDLANIEEIFPNLPWKSNEKESAAVSYQSLAAQFIRLGDDETALECLGLSDEFEESPRSFALRGLVCSNRGEKLSAVANMVSSLQQYEVQKRAGAISKLEIERIDINTVNEKLHLGLEALNHRENDTAFAHFTDAVFAFDPFFRDNGIDLVQQ